MRPYQHLFEPSSDLKSFSFHGVGTLSVVLLDIGLFPSFLPGPAFHHDTFEVVWESDSAAFEFSAAEIGNAR